MPFYILNINKNYKPRSLKLGWSSGLLSSFQKNFGSAKLVRMQEALDIWHAEMKFKENPSIAPTGLV
jgi:hypothetical protein